MSLLVSCGKKAETQDKSKAETVQPSEAEVSFYALKEVRRAVVENDLPALQRVLRENPDIDLNQILFDGDTYLILSIKYNYPQIRNFLWEKGADLNRPNVNKETPLMVAISKGRLNSVKVLLDLKVDLERKDTNGETALLLALKNLNEEVALLLIKQGANLETNDKLDRSPLRVAEESHLVNAVELIKSILQVEFGAPDLASFRSVLTQGDVKRLNTILTRYPKLVGDYETCNPLALLVEVKDENAAIRSAELLLNYQANVNGPKGAELTPLIKATTSKKQNFARLYLSSRANPQLLDKDGKSALIHAVEMNDAYMVELLLSYSAVERYTFRKDGKKITYNACTIARDMEKKLETDFEKNANKEIQSNLDCGLLNWLF